MKKLLMMMALAATTLFAVTACGDDDEDKGNSSTTETTPTLTPPPYKDRAMVLNITEANEKNIVQLRMMDSGAYMIKTEEPAATRAINGYLYSFGKYTYADAVFKFDNGMTIRTEPKSGMDYDVTITWKEGTSIKTVGRLDTSTEVAKGVMTDNLCSRVWTIEGLRAIGKFKDISLAKDFTMPIDIKTVMEWYEQNGGTIKDKFDDNLIPESIQFDSHGLFTIVYKNHKPDVGIYRWIDINKGSLTYSWNDKMMGISLFAGEATVSFQKSPEKCKLAIKGNVNDIDLQFVFTLK